jgi:hypothetical protein
MDRGLVTVIGMSIAYVASFLGMWMAWYGWKRRHVTGEAEKIDLKQVRGIGDQDVGS